MGKWHGRVALYWWNGYNWKELVCLFFCKLSCYIILIFHFGTQLILKTCQWMETICIILVVFEKICMIQLFIFILKCRETLFIIISNYQSTKIADFGCTIRFNNLEKPDWMRIFQSMHPIPDLVRQKKPKNVGLLHYHHL